MPSSDVTFGWKLGEIGEDFGRVHLKSGVFGVGIEVTDRAICFEHYEHSAPADGCSCGFIAINKPAGLIVHARAPFSQLWEVELSGRVLCEQRRYRGEVQRVTRIHLNPHCYRCRQRASVVCAREYRDVDASVRASHPFVSSCQACATDGQWFPSDLTDLLGLEVTWAEPEHAIVLLGMTFEH